MCRCVSLAEKLTLRNVCGCLWNSIHPGSGPFDIRFSSFARNTRTIDWDHRRKRMPRAWSENWISKCREPFDPERSAGAQDVGWSWRCRRVSMSWRCSRQQRSLQRLRWDPKHSNPVVEHCDPWRHYPHLPIDCDARDWDEHRRQHVTLELEDLVPLDWPRRTNN